MVKVNKRKRLNEEPAQSLPNSNNNRLPFWNEYTSTESKRWWLPEKNNCAILHRNLWNESLKRGDYSWFSVGVFGPSTIGNLWHCSSQPSCLWREIINDTKKLPLEEEVSAKKAKTSSKLQKKNQSNCDEKLPPGKSRKVWLFPSKEEKETLKKWIGTARWTYNHCLDAIQNDKVAIRKKDLRDRCLNKKNFSEKNKWVLETPYDIRDEAMNDLIKAYSSNFAAGREKFHIKYRSKKENQQSITMLSKHWCHSTGVYSFVREMKAAETLPQVLQYDSRIVLTRLGEYYLCIPEPLHVKAENQGPICGCSNENISEECKGVIALDPGVRTFMTGYDPSGSAIEWGKNDISRLYRLCRHFDKLQSIRDKSIGARHKHKRYKLRRSMYRIQKRIRNLVMECHRKLALYLCQNYRVILLPEFRTQQMIGRGNRRIRNKTARQMCTWSHYRFRQFMQHKAREYPWCHVINCTEEFTSKTCGQCGTLHTKLGGSKIFKCPSCKIQLDRDINGARNIFLLHRTKFHVTEPESTDSGDGA
jgi:putative transposase